MLSNAFNYLISLKGREVQIMDLNTSTTAFIKVADSNYFRKLEGLEETVIEGKEFVVSANDLKVFGEPKRGHRIIDAYGKHDTIGEVKPMYLLKGQIVGYRIRIQ